ncbi:NADH dehydrogenase [ubiquinone] 1 alpha subcomplex assembly factor 3 [Psidium guajava]|nr:NADH dehydrogenase [ubiquinone] 1 alpha subcomplex assembly factor 3 [Psidium guajava]
MAPPPRTPGLMAEGDAGNGEGLLGQSEGVIVGLSTRQGKTDHCVQGHAHFHFSSLSLGIRGDVVEEVVESMERRHRSPGAGI